MVSYFGTGNNFCNATILCSVEQLNQIGSFTSFEGLSMISVSQQAKLLSHVDTRLTTSMTSSIFWRHVALLNLPNASRNGHIQIDAFAIPVSTTQHRQMLHTLRGFFLWKFNPWESRNETSKEDRRPCTQGISIYLDCPNSDSDVYDPRRSQSLQRPYILHSSWNLEVESVRQPHVKQA